MPEIREGDDRLAAHAQHLGHDIVGVAHRLQRLRQDHAVEGRVVEPRKPRLEIALQHIDAVGNAREHTSVVDLDAVARRAALAGKVGEETTVPAAEIEDVRARRDPRGDGREVRAAGRRRGRGNVRAGM
jgi:hypothetical protein